MSGVPGGCSILEKTQKRRTLSGIMVFDDALCMNTAMVRRCRVCGAQYQKTPALHRPRCLPFLQSLLLYHDGGRHVGGSANRKLVEPYNPASAGGRTSRKQAETIRAKGSQAGQGSRQTQFCEKRQKGSGHGDDSNTRLYVGRLPAP